MPAHGGGQDGRPPSRARRPSAPSWPAPTTTLSTPLRDYGDHLGLAFQAIDDMLGVWGEPSVTGKPVGNDLAPTQEDAADFDRELEGFRRLRRRLGSEDTELTDAEVTDAMVLLEECGARYETMEFAEPNLTPRSRRSSARTS